MYKSGVLDHNYPLRNASPDRLQSWLQHVFKLMLIVYKSLNIIAPIYISVLLKVYTPSRKLRSSMSLQNGPGVIGLFLSQLRDSGIIFQLNSNLVIQKLDLSRCLKLILCHIFSKMMYICNCTCISVLNNYVFAITVNCLYSWFFFVSAP